MSEEELGQVNFFWENPTLGYSSAENSSGSEDRKGKKPLLPWSKSPTLTLMPTAKPSMVPNQVLSRVAKCREVNTSGGGGGGEGTESKGVGEPDHDIHTRTEKERRKKMKTMFTTLHAMMPHLPPKVKKSTIVEEAVSYIKTLEHTLQKLQRKKLERMRGMTTMGYNSSMVSPSTLTLNSREAYLADQVCSMNLAMTSINTPNSLSVPSFPVSFQTWTTPNFVLNVCGGDAQINICVPKKPGLLTTLLCVLEKHRVEVVTVKISSNLYRSMFMIHARASAVTGQFEEAMPSEEIFKLAVTEMIFWMSS